MAGVREPARSRLRLRARRRRALPRQLPGPAERRVGRAAPDPGDDPDRSRSWRCRRRSSRSRKLDQGLVLVTGPTGSGKSTTLAAIIDRINATRACHIVTIEDPVEFVHENKRSVVSHREVGPHTSRLRAGAARGGAPGRRRRAGRRAARPRDDQPRDHGGRDGPAGVRHAAHEQRREDHRPRDRRLPGRGAEPGAHQPLRVAGRRGLAAPAADGGRQGPLRGVRDPAAHERAAERDPRGQHADALLDHPVREVAGHAVDGRRAVRVREARAACSRPTRYAKATNKARFEPLLSRGSASPDARRSFGVLARLRLAARSLASAVSLGRLLARVAVAEAGMLRGNGFSPPVPRLRACAAGR